MNKTMFIANLKFYQIDEVNVIKETPKTITYTNKGSLKQITQRKFTSYHAIFDSWAEAHAILVSKIRENLTFTKSRVNFLEKKLEQVQNMS